ncbi:Aste57867_23411 [Aphanomyces stellatus]|uniref:Aste57867_23411 protein n=1 Tax=Aphanomyces stellatus TaxID=120398 RepID=A0A485LMP3_9STRA|nr:hypothetical protein As57867_023340 [Aphanomyces stellatus]VFU00057.1 Aste57867_23411 [Aphanomyces stellatus]
MPGGSGGSFNGSFASHDSILLTKSHGKSPFVVSSFTDMDWYEMNMTGHSISALLGMESMQSLLSLSHKGERLPMMESMPRQSTTHRRTAVSSSMSSSPSCFRRLQESPAWLRLVCNWDSAVLWAATLGTLFMLSIAFASAQFVNRGADHLDIYLVCMVGADDVAARSTILASSYSMLSTMINTGNFVIVLGISIYLAVECTRHKKKILANPHHTNLTSVFVLPCYELVWYALVLLAVYGIAMTLSTLRLNGDTFNAHRKPYCFFTNLPMAWIRHLVPILMIQKSISKAAVLHSIVLSGLLSVVVLSVLLFERTANSSLVGLDCCLVALYSWIKYKRMARVAFDYVYVALCLYSVVAVVPPILLMSTQVSHGVMAHVFVAIADSWIIVAIMLTLRADTKYWLGIDYNSLHTLDPARVYLRNIAEQGIVSSFSTRTSVYDVHFMIEEFKYSMIDFAMLRLEAVVAQGATAVVLRGTYHESSSKDDEDEPVAIKMYTSLFVTEDDVRRFSKETAFNVQLSHPNIVRFHGLCVVPPAICLIFEFCELGSLDVVLDSGVAIDVSTRLKMCLDACLAVAYLHSFDPPLLHRDIKTANFLLATDGLVKLSDFGESNLLGPKNDGTMTIVGSVDFMAPEMILGGKSKSAIYGTPADVYSLTIAMWHILVPGVTPWAGRSHFDVYTEVIRGQRPPLPDVLPSAVADILRQGWAADPQDRLSVASMAKMMHGQWLLAGHRQSLKRTVKFDSRRLV